MGGVANIIKKANRKGIIKKVEPPKPKPVAKPAQNKVDEAREAKELKLANKRKGRRSTILTSSSGLNDEYQIKKNNLLG
jgi:hypothetical protein